MNDTNELPTMKNPYTLHWGTGHSSQHIQFWFDEPLESIIFQGTPDPKVFKLADLANRDLHEDCYTEEQILEEYISKYNLEEEYISRGHVELLHEELGEAYDYLKEKAENCFHNIEQGTSIEHAKNTLLDAFISQYDNVKRLLNRIENV